MGAFTKHRCGCWHCGERVKAGDRCVCVVAKAHSCHVGCSGKLKKKATCPSSCHSGSCIWGDSKNGGVPLSGGADGKCTKYCSKVMGPVRYCGVGPSYQSGSYVDCTGCGPSKQLRLAGQSHGMTEKMQWMECMADCYPNPSCKEMCAEGSPDCYDQCVERYTSSVKPFWDVFKRSDTVVSDYVPT